MVNVLNAQTEKILEAAKEHVVEAISLEELLVAAKALAKNEVLGKDGIPIKFYLAF